MENNNYRAAISRRKSRKKPVKINREEVESALNDYFKKGGLVIQLKASDDHRPFNQRPVDPLDVMWKNQET